MEEYEIDKSSSYLLTKKITAAFDLPFPMKDGKYLQDKILEKQYF